MRRARHEPPRNYSLCFVPRRSILCEKVLADEGVLELIHVRELPLPFFVLEEDILSPRPTEVAKLTESIQALEK